MAIKKKAGFASKAIVNGSNVPPKEFQYKEIVKCGKDPNYFIKTYVKISHPMKGLIPFKTFEYQDECVKAYQQHRFVIVNKSRQLGLSTISAAYSLWMALFQRERNILVIATKLDVAKLFIKKVDDMFRSLPPWLVMPNVTTHSVKEIGFSNGSRIKATPTSLSAARGEALSLVVVDECAHIEGIDELWLAMWPTLSTGGSAILISTPAGVGNLFHRIWTGSISKENDFHTIELPWTVHPERDQKWFDGERKQIIAAMGERGVAQELLCAFNGSGDTFLPGNILDLMNAVQKEPIYRHPLSDDLWIWDPPNPRNRYVISADVASGAGKDYTTFHIIDTTSECVAGEFKSNKLSTDEISKILVKIGHEYNTAMLCPELNAYGLLVAQNIKNHNYPNLFYEKFRNIYSAFMQQEIRPQDLPGIYTGPKNRDEMLAKLETILRNGQLRVYSKRLIEEFKTFVWKGNRPEAMKGYNDDLIMALAIGTSIFNVSGEQQYSQEEFNRAMFMSIARNNVALTTSPLGGYTHTAGPGFIPPIFVGNNPNNPNSYQNPFDALRANNAMAQQVAFRQQEENQQYSVNPLTTPYNSRNLQNHQQQQNPQFPPGNPWDWLLK